MSHGPVESRAKAEMTAIAETIDEYLNGEDRPKKWGFALLVFAFSMEGVAEGRINYMSNAERQDMISALKELVANFEGRVPDTEGHA